jgi:2'-5' RNA ligase
VNPAGADARLFVAARLPEELAGELADWARIAAAGHPSIRRMVPEAMHVTLCFLGEQPLALVDELAAVLGGVAELLAGVGELTVGAPVWLPPRQPLALAVELGDADGGLARLHGALVADIASAIGWRADRARFRPHVTVARMRAGSVAPAMLPPTPPLRFEIDGIALLRSHLESDGARYEALASVGGW